MRKITLKKLQDLRACSSAVEWFEKQNTTDPEELFKRAIKAEMFKEINWLLVRLMNNKQKVTYAVFASEQVIKIFEKKYSGDKRPRKAIEAAKTYLKNPCTRTKKAAYTAAATADAAAADAAYAAVAAAAYADAAYAAYATAYAAYAAAATDAYAADAYAAAAAAVYAVYAAAAYTAAVAADAYAADVAYAAYADAAYAAYADKNKKYVKILTFGFDLLTRK
jgi:hypothetical protein